MSTVSGDGTGIRLGEDAGGQAKPRPTIRESAGDALRIALKDLDGGAPPTDVLGIDAGTAGNPFDRKNPPRETTQADPDAGAAAATAGDAAAAPAKPAADATGAGATAPAGDLAGPGGTEVRTDAGVVRTGTDAAPVVAKPEAQPGAAAAPVVTAKPAEDWDEFKFEEAPGIDFTVRAAKGQGERVKAAMLRRQDYDRKLGAFGALRPSLEILNSHGREAVAYFAPVLHAAVTDQRFANAIATVFDRYTRNQPLLDAAPAQPSGPGAVDPGAAAGGGAADLSNLDQIFAGIEQDPNYDVYTINASKELLKAALGPVLQRQAAIEARLQTGERTAQSERERFEQAQRARQAAIDETVQINHTFAELYPAEFTGDPQKDAPTLNYLYEYARNAGYLTRGNLGGMLVAKSVLDQMRGRENGTVPGSTAAAALDEVERAARERSTAAAAAVAQSTSGGSTAAPANQRPKPATIARHNKDGSPRTAREVAKDAVMLIEGAGAAARAS